MDDRKNISNWENVIAGLQLHCENQRDAMRNPAKVEATGDIVAVLFGVDRIALAEKTMEIVTQRNPPLQNSWGYRLFDWIVGQE